jgi:adenine-specific DNA-methyltransferase
MVKYVCETCSTEFDKKVQWTRHQKEKTSCIRPPIQNEIIETKTPTKKQLGQYFTTDETLQKFIYDTVKHKGSLLLEPSFGAGHLLKKFKEADINYPIIAYELDSALKPILTFNEHQTILYRDFMTHSILRKFKTIVGNPPFVKQSKGNLYIHFIEKCYNLLDDDGELLFIVPSDFMKVTSASSLIHAMVQNGTFTHFLFPHNEKLFQDASIDVVVFRYEKGIPSTHTNVNNKPTHYKETNGILTFTNTDETGTLLSERFHVYVGLVSGRDTIYRQSFGNIHILTNKDNVQPYIFTKTFPTGITQIDEHLRANKHELLNRKIRLFHEKNWFEWGAPRNITAIDENVGKPCIYVLTMTRKKEVAFRGTVQYFGGALLCMIPIIPMEESELQTVIAFLNTEGFQKDYLYSGRFKIGHKQLCNSSIPI